MRRKKKSIKRKRSLKKTKIFKKGVIQYGTNQIIVKEKQRGVYFMFKKFVTSLMVLGVLVFGLAIVQPEQVISQVSAYRYDQNLNGDSNYQLLDGHMGSAIYLDISSVTVKLNDPHHVYIWAQNEVTVDTEKGNAITDTRTKWYSWCNDGGNVQFAYSATGYRGEWTLFDIDSVAGTMQGTCSGFRAGFYHAFGFPFS